MSRRSLRRVLLNRRSLWLVGCALLSLFPPTVFGETQPLDRPALLPRPQHVQSAEGRFVLRDGLTISVARLASPRLREIADLLSDGLRANTGISARVVFTDASPPPGAVRLTLNAIGGAGRGDSAGNDEMDSEAYTLRVARTTIEVSASDPRGLLWGVQTLLQSLDRSVPQEPSVARGEISDRPENAWRAVMLDTVRSFLDLDFIRRTVRVMSAYKLNILHLHLVDDHAWRFESKAFPGCNPPGEPRYTQAELKELVAFAQRYGVEIVPEFDFPGHAHAAVAAYPALDCEGKTRPMDEAIFCAGKPFTWEFMDRVLAEAAEIFPSRYIHLGADEPFAVRRWSTCPDCQARMKAKGVTTTTALYHTFVIDLNALVKKHGRQMIVWNDALTPGVTPLPPTDILVDAWVDPAKVKLLAEAGYTLINSSIRPLYLSSYSQRDGFPLSAVWQWTPRVFGLREARYTDSDLKSTPLPENARVLGGQACMWATEQGVMERRLYPRLLAIAETLWSGAHRGGYADFSARLAAGQTERLHRLGVPDDAAPPTETLAASLVHVSSAVGSATAMQREVLRTKAQYRDFVLTFDRQANENTGRTGFVVRRPGIQFSSTGTAPDPAPGFAVRSSAPPGMKIGAADLTELQGWNHFELVARGAVVSLTINGYLAWSVVDPSPRAGYIALLSDGGGEGRGERAGFDVRNVQVRSLDPVGAR